MTSNLKGSGEFGIDVVPGVQSGTEQLLFDYTEHCNEHRKYEKTNANSSISFGLFLSRGYRRVLDPFQPTFRMDDLYILCRLWVCLV